MRSLIILISLLSFLFLTACTTTRPEHANDVCAIFKEYPSWYRSLKKSQERWGIPMYVVMAIMHQESNFYATIQPARPHIFGIIPWFRSSSAYGYAQAKDATWDVYRRASGNYAASRSEFDDSADFVAWYAHEAHVKLGIPSNETFYLYLAYHEGIEGYHEKTYLNKPWLVKVAHHVSALAMTYHEQLIKCQGQFSESGWF